MCYECGMYSALPADSDNKNGADDAKDDVGKPGSEYRIHETSHTIGAARLNESPV